MAAGEQARSGWGARRARPRVFEHESVVAKLGKPWRVCRVDGQVVVANRRLNPVVVCNEKENVGLFWFWPFSDDLILVNRIVGIVKDRVDTGTAN